MSQLALLESSVPSSSNFSSQPFRILKHIFSFLTVKELFQVSLVCKRLNQISQEDTTWKSCYLNTYSNPPPSPIDQLLILFFHNYPTQTWHNLALRRTHLEKEYPPDQTDPDIFEELIKQKLEDINWQEPYDEDVEAERDILFFYILERYESTLDYSARRHAKALMIYGQRKTSLPSNRRDFLSAELVYTQCLDICRCGGHYMNFIYPPTLLEYGYVLQQRAKILSNQSSEENPGVKKLIEESKKILNKAEFELRKEVDHYVKFYNLACLASIREDEEECHRLLNLLERQGHMDQLDLMCRDANFDNMRHLPWFQDFIKKHFFDTE
eukprot:TRINITY_DN2390_c0_g1_i1.p1 TRINITY_DN2390_c0_g1~~TRINITY_DN2390_c0_g1_i1.p1  ORF type:complete len:345 (-),score=63.36 TRINITY_DN2390_c0_g1_i1:232-1209(-)